MSEAEKKVRLFSRDPKDSEISIPENTYWDILNTAEALMKHEGRERFQEGTVAEIEGRTLGIVRRVLHTYRLQENAKKDRGLK